MAINIFLTKENTNIPTNALGIKHCLIHWCLGVRGWVGTKVWVKCHWPQRKQWRKMPAAVSVMRSALTSVCLSFVVSASSTGQHVLDWSSENRHSVVPASTHTWADMGGVFLLFRELQGKLFRVEKNRWVKHAVIFLSVCRRAVVCYAICYVCARVCVCGPGDGDYGQLSWSHTFSSPSSWSNPSLPLAFSLSLSLPP